MGESPSSHSDCWRTSNTQTWTTLLLRDGDSDFERYGLWDTCCRVSVFLHHKCEDRSCTAVPSQKKIRISMPWNEHYTCDVGPPLSGDMSQEFCRYHFSGCFSIIPACGPPGARQVVSCCCGLHQSPQGPVFCADTWRHHQWQQRAAGT